MYISCLLEKIGNVQKYDRSCDLKLYFDIVDILLLLNGFKYQYYFFKNYYFFIYMQ